MTLVFIVNFTSLFGLQKYQFEFQEGKAIYMALLVQIEKITEALDKGESVIGVFLDFSKGFDIVVHAMILSKLHKYGVRNTALIWFEDYIADICNI